MHVETYLMMMKVSSHASAMLVQSLDLAVDRQAEAVRSLGGEVKQVYALTGQYDLAVVLDLPDAHTSLLVEKLFISVGLFTETMRAFKPKEMAQVREKAVMLALETEEPREGEGGLSE